MSDLDEAIELLALHMTGRRGSKYEARTWEELGPDAAGIYNDGAKEVVELIAPILERAVREKVAQELEATQGTPDPDRWWAYYLSPDEAAAIARGGIDG